MMMSARKLLERFDANGDEKLDRAERQEARAWLATQPVAGPGGGRGGMPPGGMPPGGGRSGPGGPGGRGFAPGTPGAKVSPASVRSFPTGDLYATDTLRTLFLEFENADWEQELEAFNNTDVDVPATVRADGRTYREVGVHFRGASSFMMVPTGNKRSLNLSFDEFVPDQAINGKRTLNLLNAMNDPSFTRTVFYSHLANRFIEAPRVNYVRVVINGEDWGVYLNQEQFNRDFLVTHFGTPSGARWQTPGSPQGRAGLNYLGDNPAPYKAMYELKTKDSPERWASLIELTRVLNETPPEQLEAALSRKLDIDGALKFLALEVVLVNTDGYWTRASDYSMFEDSTGRFHIVPHDMNEAMQGGGGGRGGPGGPGGGGPTLDPLVGLNDASKPLRSKLLAVPALQARYLGYVRELSNTWLDWDRVGPLLTQWQQVIAPTVAADSRKLYATDRFSAEVETTLKNWLAQRRAYLDQRLTELGR
jgi:spore coat protein CotH